LIEQLESNYDLHEEHFKSYLTQILQDNLPTEQEDSAEMLATECVPHTDEANDKLEKVLGDTEELVPLAAQTFSKSKIQYPRITSMPGQPGLSKTSGLAFYVAANWRRAGVVILVVPMWGLQPISVLQQI
jgi:hypothetical protein